MGYIKLFYHRQPLIDYRDARIERVGLSTQNNRFKIAEKPILSCFFKGFVTEFTLLFFR